MRPLRAAWARMIESGRSALVIVQPFRLLRRIWAMKAAMSSTVIWSSRRRPKYGIRCLRERPAVELERARPDGLAFEPFLGVLGEGLPAGLDPFAAAAAQPQLGPLGFGVVEAAVDDLPAALAGRVEVGELVGRR